MQKREREFNAILKDFEKLEQRCLRVQLFQTHKDVATAGRVCKWEIGRIKEKEEEKERRAA